MMFQSKSRYYDIENAKLTTEDGLVILYKKRRFLPQGDEMPASREIVVVAGDRLDLIAARTIGDSEQFWRVCDANNTMHPLDLTREAGRRIKLPERRSDVPRTDNCGGNTGKRKRSPGSMQLNYPFRIDERGRTAVVDEEGHIRQMIEQILFTAPGERVNCPTFGSGINQLVFAPSSDEVATDAQLMVQGALLQWLGDLISVEAIDVGIEESTLHVSVQYRIRRTQERQVVEFHRGV